MDGSVEWTQGGDAVAVVVQERQGRTASGTVYLKVLDKAARTKRAGVALAICWGLALGSLPILFFHFFLVPPFGVLGPVMFLVRMKQERFVLGAQVDCPVCEKSTELGKQADGWPLLASCGGCGIRLTRQPPRTDDRGPVDWRLYAAP